MFNFQIYVTPSTTASCVLTSSVRLWACMSVCDAISVLVLWTQNSLRTVTPRITWEFTPALQRRRSSMSPFFFKFRMNESIYIFRNLLVRTLCKSKLSKDNTILEYSGVFSLLSDFLLMIWKIKRLALLPWLRRFVVGPSLQRPGFNTGVSYGIYGRRMTLEHVCVEKLCLSGLIITPPMIQTYSFIYHRRFIIFPIERTIHDTKFTLRRESIAGFPFIICVFHMTTVKTEIHMNYSSRWDRTAQ